MEAVAESIATVSQPDFISRIDVGEGILIDSIDVSEDIFVTIDVIVDASNVADANIVADIVTELIQQQDDSFEISSRGKLLTNLKLFNFVCAKIEMILLYSICIFFY